MSKPIVLFLVAAALALLSSPCVMSNEVKYHLPSNRELTSLMQYFDLEVPNDAADDDDDYYDYDDQDDDFYRDFLDYEHDSAQVNKDEVMSKAAPDHSNDAEETKQLPQGMEMFREYCIRSRDHVFQVFNYKANDAIKLVFKILVEESDESIKVDDDFEKNPDKYKAVMAESTREIMKLEKDKSLMAAGQEDVSKDVATSTDNSNLDTSVTAKEQPKHFGSVLLSSIKEIVRVVVESAISFASSEAAKAVAKLKRRLTVDQLQDILEDSCLSLQDLKKELRAMLKETQSKLVRQSSFERARKQEIVEVDIEKLSCVTTGRIMLVSKICGFLRVAGPALINLLKD